MLPFGFRLFKIIIQRNIFDSVGLLCFFPSKFRLSVVRFTVVTGLVTVGAVVSHGL